MAKPVIPYDKDLPEIENRRSWEKPTAHLRKKKGSEDEFEEVEGRRASKLLLIDKLRQAVDEWREAGQPGASAVTERLFNYWFEEDHLINDGVFRYYFGQREAVETLIYLIEIKKIHDAKALVDAFAEIFYPEGTQQKLPGAGIIHQTAMDGTRQIRRYIPEVEGETVQDLPPEQLRRYAFKMATGSGKTIVMAMLMVWSYFHKRMVEGSDLSTNFLLLAPNVIVYQRLEKDFRDNQIFRQLPLIPPEWKGQWNLKVILRGESTEPDPSGNLFLTNIHQIYESKEEQWTPANAVDALLGKKPVKDLASQERSMLERIKDLPDLVALNDEAHHLHDEELQWNKTLMNIHGALPRGLSLWLDFSATPKDQNGTYFPWIICDYPLAQAVEDRIVKAPLIVHQVRKKDPDQVTRKNVIDAYGEWLVAGVARWKAHYKIYRPLGVRPVLFIMAEKNDFADEIKKWLVEEKKSDFKESEVLVIHTDKTGEITKKMLEIARKAARDIDLPGNKIKVIVSVLMLREGWDVRNVTVVLGLRPMTAAAGILPEQAVGRGLRLMDGISPDKTQTLEVLGTQEFEKIVRQLEAEGVGIKTVVTPPPPPMTVEPVQERKSYDITIPLTHPIYSRNYTKLSELVPLSLDPIYDQKELEEPYRIRLKMEFAVTGTGVHQTDETPPSLLTQDLLASITMKVMNAAKLTGGFAELYPVVRDYVVKRCFGTPIDLDKEEIRSHLSSFGLRDGISRYLARKIGELTAEKHALEFENPGFKLSETKYFLWRRNLPLLVCKKTIFNYVATYNNYEKDFAKFLDSSRCADIARFSSLGTTEQESGTRFKVDYLKGSGAIAFYYPDWVAIQKLNGKEINWIIETKGREWEDTLAKDAAISHWCEQVGDQTGKPWHYVRVNQFQFGDGKKFTSFESLIDFIKSSKQKGGLWSKVLDENQHG